jgi:hypothetical protein
MEPMLTAVLFLIVVATGLSVGFSAGKGIQPPPPQHTPYRGVFEEDSQYLRHLLESECKAVYSLRLETLVKTNKTGVLNDTVTKEAMAGTVEAIMSQIGEPYEEMMCSRYFGHPRVLEEYVARRVFQVFSKLVIDSNDKAFRRMASVRSLPQQQMKK